jgi:hypothetical protein
VHATKKAVWKRWMATLEAEAHTTVGDVNWQRRNVVACEPGELPATMRGVQLAPTTWPLQVLQRHFKMVAVDEHRTSSIHYWSVERQRKVYSEPKREGCCCVTSPPNQAACHLYTNAAMNIRFCALSGATLPAHLCHWQPALHLRPLPRLRIPR